MKEDPGRAQRMTIWAVARELDGTVIRRVCRDQQEAERVLRITRRGLLGVPGSLQRQVWGEAYTDAGWAASCRAWQERGYTPPELPPLEVATAGLAV
jgi:hypothetical protein